MPEKTDFSPRIGIAWRAVKDTVVRAGYGINFANGQYVKFVQDFAFQPPWANVQTNSNPTTGAPTFTLANGFTPTSQAEGNYSVNKNYRLPYVQVWNLDIQRTLPLGIVLNVGYNGSKGTRLDIVDAPGRFGTTRAERAVRLRRLRRLLQFQRPRRAPPQAHAERHRSRSHLHLFALHRQRQFHRRQWRLLSRCRSELAGPTRRGIQLQLRYPQPGERRLCLRIALRP